MDLSKEYGFPMLLLAVSSKVYRTDGAKKYPMVFHLETKAKYMFSRETHGERESSRESYLY